MSENNVGIRLREIDVSNLLRKMRKKWKLFAVVLCIVMIVSASLIFCVPRYYTCSVKLAPETASSGIGSLGSLAASFGVNIGSGESPDAILPEFYPDVMRSVDFETSMFPVKVTSKDGEINTTYYDYLLNYQKAAWWMKGLGWVLKLIKPKPQSTHSKGKKQGIDPFELTLMESEIAKTVGGNIRCAVDKKTQVITLTVQDQDPLISALIADSAKNRLQQFMIQYRTGKARGDLQHAEKLMEEAKAAYKDAQKRYALFADANDGIYLPSYKVKMEELENEMQLQYNSYQAMVQQVQMAQAKVQERIPAFTTLQSATVPIKPAGPKRVVFIAFCMFVAFIVTTIHVYRKAA